MLNRENAQANSRNPLQPMEIWKYSPYWSRCESSQHPTQKILWWSLQLRSFAGFLQVHISIEEYLILSRSGTKSFFAKPLSACDRTFLTKVWIWSIAATTSFLALGEGPSVGIQWEHNGEGSLQLKPLTNIMNAGLSPIEMTVTNSMHSGRSRCFLRITTLNRRNALYAASLAMVFKTLTSKRPKTMETKRSKSTQTDPAKTKEIFWLFGSKPKERNVD